MAPVGLFGGSQLAASESPFCRFALASVGCRFSGSLANATRLAYGHGVAPFCHASDRATTWSMSTSLGPPYSNRIVVPVYGSSRVPASTLHELAIVWS